MKKIVLILITLVTVMACSKNSASNVNESVPEISNEITVFVREENKSSKSVTSVDSFSSEVQAAKNDFYSLSENNDAYLKIDGHGVIRELGFLGDNWINISKYSSKSNNNINVFGDKESFLDYYWENSYYHKEYESITRSNSSVSSKTTITSIDGSNNLSDIEINYTHDTLGRLKSFNNSNSISTGTVMLIDDEEFYPNAYGDITYNNNQGTIGNLTISYEFDNLSRITDITVIDSGNSNKKTEISYIYDSNGGYEKTVKIDNFLSFKTIVIYELTKYGDVKSYQMNYESFVLNEEETATMNVKYTRDTSETKIIKAEVNLIRGEGILSGTFIPKS